MSNGRITPQLQEAIAASVAFHAEGGVHGKPLGQRATAARIVEVYHEAFTWVRGIIAEDASIAKGVTYGEVNDAVLAAVVGYWHDKTAAENA